jgi:hypothetical protein
VRSVNAASLPMEALRGEPVRMAPLLETLITTQDMSRKTLEMEHLSPIRGSVWGTWWDNSYTEGYDRHVMEGSRNEALLLQGNPR